MSIVGPDGQTPISTDAETIKYSAGGIQLDSTDTPESTFQKALAGAQQVIAQQVGAATLQSTGSHTIAQTQAQQAAARVSNPFQIEPCALGVFMLLSREIEHRDRIISALAKRLDKVDGENSDDLLKDPWKDLLKKQKEEAGKSEGVNDAFAQAAENLTKKDLN